MVTLVHRRWSVTIAKDQRETKHNNQTVIIHPERLSLWSHLIGQRNLLISLLSQSTIHTKTNQYRFPWPSNASVPFEPWNIIHEYLVPEPENVSLSSCVSLSLVRRMKVVLVMVLVPSCPTRERRFWLIQFVSGRNTIDNLMMESHAKESSN